jgi:hypothetical protein
LLGLALQLLDRPRHRLYGLVFFRNAQPCGFIRFLPGLLMNLGDRGLDAPLDGQIEFALFLIQRSLLAYQLGLGSLRFRQFSVVGFKRLAKFSGLVCFGL